MAIAELEKTLLLGESTREKSKIAIKILEKYTI